MSHVDNAILTFSILEESFDLDHEAADHWPLMDKINAWLRENAGGQQFGPELGSVQDAYGGHKALEAPLFVAAFNYLPEDEFLAFLRTLPWKYPDEVQYIVQREHDDTGFEIVTLS